MKFFLAVGLLLIALSIAQASLNDEIISYYNMSQTSNAIDMKHLHNGSIGGTSVVSGKLGNALYFNSTTADYIDFGDVADFEFPLNTSNGTIAFWMNYSGKDDTATTNLINKRMAGGGYYIQQEGTSKKIFVGYLTTTPVLSTAGITANAWNHVAVTFNSSGAYLYMNGALNSSQTDRIATSTSVQNFNIASQNASQNFFDGMIDDVIIYNRSLSASEISQLYNSGNGLAYPFGSINVTFNSPSANSSSLTLNINATIASSNAISACYYNLTKGASTEKADTLMTYASPFANATYIVSQDSTNYTINVWCNDSLNTLGEGTTYSYVSTGGGSSSGGGGGGGGTKTTTQTNQTFVSVCEGFATKFRSAKAKADGEGKDFISGISIYYKEFYDFILCKSAASIVPI